MWCRNLRVHDRKHDTLVWLVPELLLEVPHIQHVLPNNINLRGRLVGCVLSKCQYLRVFDSIWLSIVLHEVCWTPSYKIQVACEGITFRWEQKIKNLIWSLNHLPGSSIDFKSEYFDAFIFQVNAIGQILTNILHLNCFSHTFFCISQSWYFIENWGACVYASFVWITSKWMSECLVETEFMISSYYDFVSMRQLCYGNKFFFLLKYFYIRSHV